MLADHPEKTAPNQACPCQSGKKYKHCCANKAVDQPRPDTSDYQALLANARYQAYQLRDFAEAERCFRKVLTIKPNNAEALAGVGQGLFWRHRRREGLSFMVKAAKVLLRQADKSDIRQLADFAEQLQIWGELNLSMQLSRAVLKRDPKHLMAQFTLIGCLHRLNHLDQALTLMQKLLKQHPENASFQVLMAIIELDSKKVADAGLRLEQVIQTETNSVHTARAFLELAKIYDKQKRYDDAFTALTRAAVLQSQLPETRAVSREILFNRIKRYKSGFDSTLLKRWSVHELADQLPIPVFLFGFLRSGTTLTEQVLSAHAQIITSDENELISELIGLVEQLTHIEGDLPKALTLLDLAQVRYLRHYYWQRASEEYGKDVYHKVFINKVALNSIEAGFISVLFPDAKVLFALRDPRDICLSCAMQSFTASPGTVNLLSWQGIAQQYSAVMDLWLTLKPHIAFAYLEIRYEDTVQHFESSFRQIFSFFALDWQADVSRFHERVVGKVVSTPSFTAVSQPLYQSAVARWQSYQAYYSEVLPYLQPYIQAFGYET